MSRIFKLVSATVTVSAAGTAVPLSSTTLYTNFFVVKAVDSTIYLGDENVDNTGLPLAAAASADSNSLNLRSPSGMWDLSKIYIDADTNGDKAVVMYSVDLGTGE